jgi:type IV pilus assembly protein PilP
MRISGLLACLMGGLVVLSGCGGGEHEEIRQWMAESSKDLRGAVPPLPELKPFPIVSYEAGNMLDPFSDARVEPERNEGAGGGKKPDFERPREQLENFPLESIQFVGVMNMNKKGERNAIVKVDGVVYRVTKGNYMGQNFGHVISINDNEINLVETVQDPSGQTNEWVERNMTLQLLEGLGKEGGK